MMKTFKITFLLLAIFALAFNACKKREFDAPPQKVIPTGGVFSIQTIKALIDSSPLTSIRYNQDNSLFVIVTADERTGNLYKNVFVRDSLGGAINIRLTASGGLYQGDYLRIYLKGIVLDKVNGMYQLDSVDATKNIIKLGVGRNLRPITTTIEAILLNGATSLQSHLVKLENVQFGTNDTALTWSDAIGKTNVNRNLEDCQGKTIILRNSGFSSFAGIKMPKGNGSLIGVVTVFGTTAQLVVRTNGDAVMNGVRCGPYLKKDFEDGSLTSGGWEIKMVNGTSSAWVTKSFGSSKIAVASNFTGTSNFECDTWLVSPPIDLSKAIKPVLSFENAYKYNGNAMEVYVSNTYTGGLPNPRADWAPVGYTASPGNFVFVGSGNLDLTNYKTTNVRVAFRYFAGASSGSTWEIDNVFIKEQ